jgi:hypothetical protein
MSITLERPALKTQPPPVNDTPTVEAPAKTHTLTILGGCNEQLSWSTTQPKALEAARERFKHYADLRYLAYTVDGAGGVVTRDFVPNADLEMHPQIVGG